MIEDSNSAIYGIIGNPLAHSLSPVMHNAAFEALEVDAVYKLFPLKEEELDGFFKDLKDPSSPIFGLNVTVPYKEKVMPFLDALSPFAAKVGAVNTIVIDDKRKLTGHNTDGPGFLCHLQELGVDITDKRIAVLGAGGSARAILTSLCLLPERPESIRIYNRTAQKVEDLIVELGGRMNVDILQAVNVIEDLNIELCDILINTTTVGMQPTDPMLIDHNLLHKDMLVYDIIYNPAKTLLLKEAQTIGANTTNGLGMLFYQGVLALQHWANQEIDVGVKILMRDKLEEESYGH
ncbi:MAG: shikimate dehydrogenase [Candidatus Omnitrophica bacterium]|nr:shikimate dehydrogenase [Candidatus Omnitrophota bacterium]